MQKTLIGLTIVVAAVFGIGSAAGQIGGISGSSAAATPTPSKIPLRLTRVPIGLRPQAAGIVTTVSGSTITITADSHISSVTTITVGFNTKYQSGPNQASSLNAVKSGLYIGAEGIVSSDATTLAATNVQVFGVRTPIGPGGPGGPRAMGLHADGKVTAISGNTITVAADAANRPGSTDEYTKVTTITVSSSTRFELGPGRQSTLGSIKVGSLIIAVGTLSSDGTTLTASRVGILPATRRTMAPLPGGPDMVLPARQGRAPDMGSPIGATRPGQMR